jgi:hypothetical protein
MQRSVYIHMVMIGQKKKERSASPAKKADHCRYSWQGLRERFA